MLLAKLIVPITRKIHTDISQLSPRGRRCDSSVLCKTSRKVERQKVVPKCKEYQEKLAKCFRSPSGLCRGKRFSGAQPKCEMRSAVDDYQRAYESVTNRARSILADAQNETKSTLDQLTKDIKVSKNNEQIQLEQFLDNIKKTLQKLLALDPSCGSLKRKSAMSLGHQVCQAFDNVECDIVPQVKRIERMIEKLQRDVLGNIERAKSLILSCRKCVNPQALTKCIEENASYAEKILDKTTENTRVNLKKIEALQREVFKYHKATIIEISRKYRKECDAFLQHLNDCISAIRNQKKQR
ncbi:uncharacterized protein LOC143428643 [Xylocopa sonorina]|uniref:uncharacterized protein LOC143428643 n=1 Tax=Xylocopa sonorina TaxID=1818115 RepID=UPI00403A94FE